MEDPLAVRAVAALDEPTRRRLYEHVVRSPEPLGRDEVARETGVARATVAFHLDKLVEENLLDVTYERRTGRTGPGAGRPSKLYRRSARQVAVSLPERRYDLAGRLLAAAVEEADTSGAPVRPILERRAYDFGRTLGAVGADAVETLEAHGFEPRTDGEDIVLGNCPFHTLATSHTQLVCGMNLCLIKGLLDGLGEDGHRARLDPAPGHCCVRVSLD